jgi:hypothetical protein
MRPHEYLHRENIVSQVQHGCRLILLDCRPDQRRDIQIGERDTQACAKREAAAVIRKQIWLGRQWQPACGELLLLRGANSGEKRYL